MSGEATVHVTLSIREARALIRAESWLIDLVGTVPGHEQSIETGGQRLRAALLAVGEEVR
jgi:hypothetical protein